MRNLAASTSSSASPQSPTTRRPPPATTKIKKSGAPLTIKLKPTVDILATVAARPDAPFCVGFAAESNDVARNADEKRRRKKLPLLVANRRAGRLRQRRKRGHAVRRRRRASAAADGQARARATARSPRSPRRLPRGALTRNDGAHGDDRAQGPRRAHPPAPARVRNAGLGRHGPARVHRRRRSRLRPARSSWFRPASPFTSPIPDSRR